jgi:hypothetical protein
MFDKATRMGEQAQGAPQEQSASPLGDAYTSQLQVQREAPVGQLSRSYRGEENGEVEVTGFGPEPRG